MEILINNTLEVSARDFFIDTLSSSYNIKSINFNEDKIIIDVTDDVSENEFVKNIKKLIYISKSMGKELLFKNNDFIHSTYHENPMKYLESNQEVRKIANGIYMFQGRFLKLLNFFNQYFKDLSINKYNAVEQEYPTIWPIDLFKKINYFREFPQQVMLATTVKNSFEDRNKFSDKYNRDNNFEKIDINDNLDHCSYGLEPSVCNTCYYALSNMKEYQNTVYTTYNKVFRNEFSASESLDRLMNFSVRDIMFVGDQNFVLEKRQLLIDDIIEFLKNFNIDCKIESANDPFFSNDIARKLFQYSFGLKYEILARINYSDSYIAIGSINLHLSTFGEAFNIRLPDNSFAQSGCVGIGFERLVYALYCQFGHDVNMWPDELKNKLKLQQ